MIDISSPAGIILAIVVVLLLLGAVINDLLR